MDFENRIKITLFSITILLVVLVQIVFLIQGNWFSLILSVLTLLLIFLPSVLNRRISVDYPDFIVTQIVIYLYMSAILGSLIGYFEKYWWWDLFVHLLLGLVVGSIGFLLVLELTKHRPQSARLSPGMVAIFAFAFSVAIGTLWEITEFTVDYLFGTELQLSSLTDTMADLVADTVGALIISLTGLFYLRYPRDNLVKQFVEKQKKLKKSIDNAVEGFNA
ncbi:hypothetical protein [Methanolobus chelungpuianus]|uniref:hypothetical protein n=1 Tax=Methanolobus chelungpuianus TaxID=502115 RepID=UPI00211393EA|nr:hypothetical protein [Methanolobus chelungpuianus]